jgi:hypothetical protein
MNALNLNTLKENCIATCIHPEVRTQFLHAFQNRGELIDPHSRLVLIDNEMHKPENFVACTSNEEFAAVVADPLSYMKKKEYPTYGFIYSKVADVNIIRDYIDNGIATMLSIKGFLFSFHDKHWFLEFTRAEDTILIKEQLKPGADPESIHICARHRELRTMNGNHFICGRQNRKELNDETKVGSMNMISHHLFSSQHLDTSMLKFLKSLTVSENYDEDEAPASKKKKVDKGISQAEFNSLPNEKVKELILERMKFRIKKGELKLPKWISVLFATMKTESKEQKNESVTLASIFNVSDMSDEELCAINLNDAFEKAIQKGTMQKEPRRFVALYSSLMRAFGLV